MVGFAANVVLLGEQLGAVEEIDDLLRKRRG